MNYEKIMKQARETNKARDAAEIANGLLALSESSDHTIIETAMEAIRAGIVMGRWDYVAEAQAMLEVLNRKWAN